MIHEAASITFSKLLSEICDENTKGRLMRAMIQPALYKLRQSLKETVAELLEPHLSIHPITYNEDLTGSVTVTQAARHKRKFDATSRSVCNLDTDTVIAARHETTYSSSQLLSLLKALLSATEPNPREYAATLCADVAAAYYKVYIHCPSLV